MKWKFEIENLTKQEVLLQFSAGGNFSQNFSYNFSKYLCKFQNFCIIL